MNLSTKSKQTYRHKKTDFWWPKGRWKGEGWTGSLKLADANYYAQDGYIAKSYCKAQGTIYSFLR